MSKREREQDEDDTHVKMDVGQEVHRWSFVLYVLQRQAWYVVSLVWCANVDVTAFYLADLFYLKWHVYIFSIGTLDLGVLLRYA